MNMFKTAKPKSVNEYLLAVPNNRKKTIDFLHNLIQETVPKLEPFFAKNMIGYGTFPYFDYKNEQAQWPIIALANKKNYISLYICAVDNGEYLAEKYSDQLGKVTIGKNCIRFTRIENIDLDILRKILKKAAIKPGLLTAGERKKKK